MSAQPATLDLQTLRRFIRAVTELLTSEVRRKAIALLFFLLAFALSINGLNVVSSYVGRDFMTAIAHREMAEFVRLAILYIGLFAAMTAVAVFYRFAEERLGLLWRGWLTRRVTERYLDGRTYLRLKESAEIDNPDQRIAEDTRAFTTTTLSFTLIFLNSTLAAISFSGVLWTISPLLFVVAARLRGAGHAHDGPAGPAARRVELPAVRPGGGFPRDSDPCPRERRIDCALASRGPAEGAAAEPDRRTGGKLPTDHVGESKPGLFHNGLQLSDSDHTRLDRRAAVHSRGGRVRRDHAVGDGLHAASRGIFTHHQSVRFDLLVRRGRRAARRLAGAVEREDVDRPGIETVEDRDRVAYERLTLRRSGGEGPLLADVSVSIPRGTRVLVTGPNEAARTALFRATAGIWSHGEGRIIRPTLDAILFLPQQPYLTPGTLRHQLLRTGQEPDTPDEQILAALHDGGLDSVVQRAGGLDTEHDWPAIFSLGEQQQLVVIRVILARPSFAILDRVSTALGQAQLQQSLRRLTASSITYINFDQAAEPDPLDLYDAVLEIDENGGWTWSPLGPADSSPDARSGPSPTARMNVADVCVH